MTPQAPSETKATDPKKLFIHRDLSWLDFNERVLEEASDTSNPLLERLKFMAIFANNLDEFFMVRVAGLSRLLDAGYNRKDDFGYYPQELYDAIRGRTETLLTKLYSVYHDCSEKEAKKNGIKLLKAGELNAEQKKAAKRLFETTLFPIVTPMAVDQGHPFPVLPSKTNIFAVYLNRNEAVHLALIAIPHSVPRLFRLPSEKDEFCGILVDDIIRDNLDSFFRGYKIVANFIFRVIRDSELSIKEEYTANLLKTIEAEIKNRSKAKVVCLQVEKQHHDQLLELICEGLSFPGELISVIDGALDLTYLFSLARQDLKPELSYKSFLPKKIELENIFDSIKESDFILHMPYESFQLTVDLIQRAAVDRDVLGIKMTLYRTNDDSAIIAALLEAAKNKNQVTVLVELKARFDEERNIDWTKDLKGRGLPRDIRCPGHENALEDAAYSQERRGQDPPLCAPLDRQLQRADVKDIHGYRLFYGERRRS